MPELTTLAQELLKLGIAESTRGTYDSARRSYSQFARIYQCPSAPPIDACSVVLWMTWMFANELEASTVRTYLYGINNWHLEEGCLSPLKTQGSVQLWRCWKGIKRWRGRNAPTEDKR